MNAPLFTETELAEFKHYFGQSQAADVAEAVGGRCGLKSLEAEWGIAKCNAVAQELVKRAKVRELKRSVRLQ